MSNIIPFQFENTEVRAVNINNEAWFVGSEVAKALGYSDADKAVRNHCKAAENYKPAVLAGLGIEVNSPRGLILIPERDVYRLIMRSKLPSAEQFEEKVVGEILPSIRKTGNYSLSPSQHGGITKGIVNKAISNFLFERISNLFQLAF